jgi:hypothetical protein
LGTRAGRKPGQNLRFHALLVLLIVGVAVAVPAGVRHAFDAPFEAVLWILFIAASSLLALPALPRVNLDVSLSAPLAVATAVLFPPPLVVLVNFLGPTNEREFHRTASVSMSLFNRAQLGLAAGAASLAAAAQPFGDIVGTIAAVLVYNASNIALVTIGLWTRRQLDLTEAARGSTAPFPRFAVDYGLVLLLALFTVNSCTDLTEVPSSAITPRNVSAPRASGRGATTRSPSTRRASRSTGLSTSLRPECIGPPRSVRRERAGAA